MRATFNLVVDRDAVFRSRVVEQRRTIPDDNVGVLDALAVAKRGQFAAIELRGIGLGHPEIVEAAFLALAAVPGIAFLSGGQSDEEATAHLNAMNRIGNLPWRLTFSYGRALQHAPQKTWSGKPENVAAAQRAFSHRARMNGLASLGQWKSDLEKKAA